MHTQSPHSELIKIIKVLSVDDYVLLIHLINKINLEYKYNNRRINDSDTELLDINIDLLNTLSNITEIKDIAIEKLKDFNDEELNNLIEDIKDYKNSSSYRSHDLSVFKNDERLLNFALYRLTKNRKNIDCEILNIKHKYLRFIYIISVAQDENRVSSKLDRIESSFSKIIVNKGEHFKNDTLDFYKWVIKYLKEDKDQSRRLDLRDFTPIQDIDFKITVLSILDKIYDTDENLYIILKDKISNAWYQKTYRQNNKGKKHYYFFTDKSKECLKVIAAKENLSEEKALEKLINEHFIKHYTYHDSGKHIYSVSK
ncbi:MAG: hypothetical protein GAK29_03535 [Acinetobacter bereziniae]|uniref:Uncharacterized protein n=1 Tax=Acinetobacter bereziniae TaxID=106648 RepID=A0A833PAF0_ACIBZ|nr:MAG: hypothetical protein GAK29_03535 [Acinetobacter bereziniae]